MTEKEKMLAGDWYDSRDQELLGFYHHARKCMKELNSLDSNLQEKKITLFQSLLGSLAEGVWIEAPFYCDYGRFVDIGAGTFINANCMFQDNNLIQIGSNCLIGPSVQLYTAIHPINSHERIVKQGKHTRYLTKSKPIVIGDNCWIGGNTVILPGVTIGNNVTIGAGSVVTQAIPSDVIAFGNPCKVYQNLT
jgi:maltose O-acetyltransferase